MWRLMLAVFAWPVLVAILASAILWYRAEFPERPDDRGLDPVESRTALHEAERALATMQELPPVEQWRLRERLGAALQPVRAWADDLYEAEPRILCLGEQHEPSTRRFLAERILDRYSVDAFMIEATPRELERIEAWLQEGRDYVPLLDADIGLILRTVRRRNPEVVVHGIEETAAQADARDGGEGSREGSLVRNFWRAWQPGGRNVILYGALHCSSRGMWLYRHLHEQLPAREDVSMHNVRVLGTEQHVPTRAFVYLLHALRLGRKDFAIADTDAIPPQLRQWLPFFSEDVLSRYAAVVIFHQEPGEGGEANVSRPVSNAPGSADVLPQWVPGDQAAVP